MKIVDLSLVTPDQAIAIQNAIDYHMSENPVLDWKLRDKLFEERYRCELAYDRDSKPMYLFFQNEDWAWFLLKWT